MDNWLKTKLSGHKDLKMLFIALIWSVSSNAFNFYEATGGLFTDLNKGDSAAFYNHFLPDAKFYNIGTEGLEMLPLYDFAPVIRKFKTKEYQEVCTGILVTELETGLTHIDVHFDFYINEKLAFSGIDHVIWIKEADGFRIAALYSGALKPKFTTSNGTSTITGELDQLMLKWHTDAATFELESYFNFMTADFIFLGTDPSERWSKVEFLTFCKPYFEKKSTWNFKKNWRNWYMSETGNVAWFEESLDTQMEECRGSGVLVKENGIWKIAHYNLSVLIENEKMDKFIKLRKK